MYSFPAAALTKHRNLCALSAPQSCVAHSSGGLKSEIMLVVTVPLKPVRREALLALPSFLGSPQSSVLLGS